MILGEWILCFGKLRAANSLVLMDSDKGWRQRKARVQLAEVSGELAAAQQTQSVNIWYGKWQSSRHVSVHRLDPERDSGVTRGDSSGTWKFCLYFARGLCALGHKCEYLHHVPEQSDFDRYLVEGTPLLDCFGREKHAENREDMAGVGSFNQQNRTLYVGNIGNAAVMKNGKPLNSRQVESRIRYMFGRLGPMDRVRYLPEKNCAFVRYRHHITAEFAKEAMRDQSLSLSMAQDAALGAQDSTGLLVKWAREDPDPQSRAHKEEDLVNALLSLLPPQQTQTTSRTTSRITNKTTNEATSKVRKLHRKVYRTTTAAMSHKNILTSYDSD